MTRATIKLGDDFPAQKDIDIVNKIKYINNPNSVVIFEILIDPVFLLNLITYERILGIFSLLRQPYLH